MKFGVIFANAGLGADPEQAVALGQTAEAAGYESLWTVEHVVVPADYESSYPYSKDGKMPGSEDNPIPDPLIWLAFVGAHTKTIRLATGILILPQRNPLVLAKETATLDLYTGGRLILGVGVGWLEEEFKALGFDFASRAATTDEFIQALRIAWTEAEPTFHGQFADFDRAKLYPKPAQAGGPPIVIGGHTKAAARRAGRFGDGFFPARAKPEELTGLIAAMREAAEEAGRDPDAIELTCGGALDVDGVKRFEDLGVHRIVIPNFGTQMLEQFSENVIQKL